jgi:hypothetical protein
VLVVKVAVADDQSGVLWGGVAVGLCVLTLFVPLPFLRFLIAGALAFGLMIAHRVVTNR